MKALPAVSAGAAFHKWDHGREVERRDAGDDAERLAHGIDVDAGTGAFAELALQHLRGAATKFDHFQATLNIADRVRHRLAVFGGEQLGERAHFRLHELKEFEHHPSAALRVERGPGGLGGLGDIHSLGKFGGRGQGDLRLDFTGMRGVNVAEAPTGAGDGLSADKMPDFLHALPPGLKLLCLDLILSARILPVRRA